MALLMGPAPACWLACVSGWALALAEWQPACVVRWRPGGAVLPCQWCAASPAEAIRAEL